MYNLKKLNIFGSAAVSKKIFIATETLFFVFFCVSALSEAT
jgi:hypothetical protein